MGVVGIKPKYVKEILGLIGVLDKKSKDKELIVFETEGAPYGAVNVTIFKGADPRHGEGSCDDPCALPQFGG